MFRITPRIYGSIISNIILFLLTLALSQVDTDSWQDGFYYLTLATALLFNINDSIFQGAFASLMGRFPERYMNSLAQGNHIKHLTNKSNVVFTERPGYWRDYRLCDLRELPGRGRRRDHGRSLLLQLRR